MIENIACQVSMLLKFQFYHRIKVMLILIFDLLLNLWSGVLILPAPIFLIKIFSLKKFHL